MTIDPFTSARQLAAAFRSRELSPVDAAGIYLKRISDLDGALNAFVWLDPDDTLARARKAEARYMAGAPLSSLDGVPIPIKALTAVKGEPFDQASAAMNQVIPAESDLSVERLESAGMVLMGRTNSPEFGPIGATENIRYGETRNPWNPEYSPSGSSGGAAVAVAAGMAPVAHGSDGAGSIRLPSATVGLVGLKPSRGRVPTRLRGWEHSTTEGALTRTVGDAAAMLDVLSSVDLLGFYTAPAAPRPFIDEIAQPVRPLRVGVLLDAPGGYIVDDECRTAALTLAEALRDMGHDVRPVTPFLYSPDTILEYNASVVSSWIAAIEMDHPEKADAYIRDRVAKGERVTGGQYARAVARLQRESRRVVSQWGTDFDVLVTPTSAAETPRVGVVRGEANANPEGPRTTELRQILFTAFCNMAGLPAISVPVHTAANGLPVGAQIVGGPYDEATLLQLASALERTFEWDKIHPSPDLAEMRR